MRHFPIFLSLNDQLVVVSGAGACAAAKLRLLFKTGARIAVFGSDVDADVARWAAEGRLSLTRRAVGAGDFAGARLVYAANDDAQLDARAAQLGRAAGVLVNIVDNLSGSDFITPAIVDRAPVTVAIGTEGAAPVLARQIKARIEAMLPASLGALVRVGQAFRGRAGMLPMGRARRAFWSRFYFERGPRAMTEGGAPAAEAALYGLLGEGLRQERVEGRVSIVGAGPGDPDLLTRRALSRLHEADVVIHDRLVAPEVLELARREALLIAAGKEGYGPGWSQSRINEEMIAQARAGHHVVRLKGGDPAIFARLEEETAALRASGTPFEVVPGITTASAAVSALGLSLTARGRNSALQIISAHDVDGFAEADWRALAAPNQVAAIYMGKRAARFLSGRLLMHGADRGLPVTAIENVSRTDQRILPATLGTLADALEAAAPRGPVILLYGIAPGRAEELAEDLPQMEVL